jgi:hypothetical protein
VIVRFERPTSAQSTSKDQHCAAACGMARRPATARYVPLAPPFSPFCRLHKCPPILHKDPHTVKSRPNNAHTTTVNLPAGCARENACQPLQPSFVGERAFNAGEMAGQRQHCLSGSTAFPRRQPMRRKPTSPANARASIYCRVPAAPACIFQSHIAWGCPSLAQHRESHMRRRRQGV